MTNAPTTRETADHAELARLAEAAYSSGPWEAHSIEHPYEATKGPSGYEFPAGSYSEWQIRTAWVHGQAKGKVSVVGLASGRDGASVWLHKDDAAFIAAFNPTTCLTLLSEIAALRVREAALIDGKTDMFRRATQAERQRDEALDAALKLSAAISWTDYPFIDNNTSREEMISRLGFMQKDAEQPRAFLANQGADQGAAPTPVKKELAWICPQDNTPCPPECDSDDRRHCASVACKEQPA